MKDILSGLMTALVLFSVIIGCTDKEEKEKIDLQEIKEDRRGLDYRGTASANVMMQLDNLLKRWHSAQRKMDPYAFDLEKELSELSRGHFSALIKELQGGNAFIAAAALGFSGDMRAIPYLLDALKAGALAVRSNAAMSLGHIASDQTPMASLYQHLHDDPEASVRAMIAFAIGQIITKKDDLGALPHLLRALNDKAVAVRNNVVLALEKTESKEAGRAIVATTLNDEVATVRYNSIRVLSIFSDKEYITPLINKLRDRIPEIAAAALQALKDMTGKDFGLDVGKWEKWAGMPPSQPTPASQPAPTPSAAPGPATSNR